MNKNKIFYLFFLVIPCIMFSQTGIITYKVKKTRTVKKTSRPEVTRKINEEINRSTFTLIFDNKKSYFKKNKIIPIYPFEYKVAQVYTNSRYNWHQFNKIEKFSTYSRKFKKMIYLVDHSDKMKNWKLTSEIKIIDGYTCYKAVKNVENKRQGIITKIIAWYTPDIPIPYGPIGFGGLPGLILHLKIDKSQEFIVDKIILNPKKKIKIPQLEKGKVVSVEEIIRISKDNRKVTPD